MKKYYISTAIAYTSGKPHIGNTYDIVLADILARYKRSQGFNVYFQTGTDEHGQKIQDKAHEAKVNPQDYVDKIAGEIKNIWDLMDTTYDKFIRTSNPEHKKLVNDIFDKMYEKGDIYLGEYTGLYCKPCEAFWTETQLVDGKCPDCGRKVEKFTEEAYFFKLTNYQDRLIKYIEEHDDFIAPMSRKNEIYNNFLKPGLQDLCISRISVDWGIKINQNPKHVVYVWLDALANYITSIGYDTTNPTDEFNDTWPADLHVIGKDIIRFHAIYWPCFLWSLSLELPKKIFAHPWLLMNNDKMSKSKNNVIYADELVEKFGVDGVRYYLAKEISYSNDGNITYDLIKEKYNSELANTLGNLVQRTISMGIKYFSGKIKINKKNNNEFIIKINNLNKEFIEKMDTLYVAEALEKIIVLLRNSNKYIDETTPWILAKDETKKEELEEVIYNLLEAIRVSALLLESFIPSTSKKIIEQLNIDDKSLIYNEKNLYNLNKPEVLFSRIED